MRFFKSSPPGSNVGRRAALAAALSRVLPTWAQPLQRGEAVDWPVLPLLDAEPFPTSHWHDRAAVLVFFTTTCPFCLRHNQRLQQLHEATQGRRLQVLGAALGESAEVLRAYQRRRGLSFPVTLQGEVLRPRFSARTVIPLTAVIDRQGTLRELIPGEMADDDVMGLLRYAEPVPRRS